MNRSMLIGFVCSAAILAFPSPTSAQPYEYISPQDSLEYEAYWLTLPRVTPPSPPGQLPWPLPTDVPGEMSAYFRWDQVPELDPWGVNITVNYTVTAPYNQTGGTCYLFGCLTAMEIETAISSTSWYWWASETERGVRLSAMNMWSCNHWLGSHSGYAREPMNYMLYHGVPEDCFNPYINALGLPAHGQPPVNRPPCDNCDRYLYPRHLWPRPNAIHNPANPASCSPWQLQSNEVLYYRHLGWGAVDDVHGGRPEDFQRLATAIRYG